MSIEDVRALRLQGKNIEAWTALTALTSSASPCATEDKPEYAYERSILNYYVGIPKEDALRDFIISYSRFKNIDYNNLLFYVIPFTSSYTSFPIQEIPDFLPTSTSILPLSNKILLNVRYVNYRIQENGSYLMSEGGVLTHAHLRTRNFFLFTDPSFSTFSTPEEIVPAAEPFHPTNIHGIEDIRLFTKGAKVYFSGTTCEYSHNGSIQEIQGTYDIDAKKLTELIPMHSPTNSHVEKNWIPLNRAYDDDSRFIYSWYPLQIGRINNGHFHLESESQTPYFFRHVRGSSTLVYYENFLYTMVHCVIETCPRKYYHMLVKLDMANTIVSYTVPYYFVKNHIEYTLGIYIADSQLTCIASQNDCDPIIVRIPMNSLSWI